MEIHDYPFRPIDSRMYLVIEEGKAFIIDPCVSDEALELLSQNGIKQVEIFLTHEHYDHISGVNWWRKRLDVTVICSQNCAERICDARKNASAHYDVLFLFLPKEVQEEARKIGFESYTCTADVTFEGQYEKCWAEHRILIDETPGHSKGSCCIKLDDTICFTGDSLIKGRKTITRLPEGDRERFKRTKEEYFKSLPIDCRIFPGHGEPFYMRDINIEEL